MTVLGRMSVVVTAWRRPYYLERTLDAWSKVRGVHDVRRFAVALGHDPVTRAEQFEVISQARRRMNRGIEVWEDSPLAVASPGMHRALGEAGQRAFEDPGTGFTVFGEEDILPADDVLEYMSWAEREFRSERVLLACAHNCGGQGWDELGIADKDADPEVVRLRPYFNPWIWGTWDDRWPVLEADWDWSCNSGGPNDSGYDWQIAARLIPQNGYHCLVPDASRSQNIGRDEGVYAIPDRFGETQSASYRESFGPVAYRLVS
jgi:hypothetical protein